MRKTNYLNLFTSFGLQAADAGAGGGDSGGKKRMREPYFLCLFNEESITFAASEFPDVFRSPFGRIILKSQIFQP